MSHREKHGCRMHRRHLYSLLTSWEFSFSALGTRSNLRVTGPCDITVCHGIQLKSKACMLEREERKIGQSRVACCQPILTVLVPSQGNRQAAAVTSGQCQSSIVVRLEILPVFHFLSLSDSAPMCFNLSSGGKVSDK